MDNVSNATEVNIHVRRISWGAIFAGALIMIVVMMLLSLLGIGIGLGSLNPLSDRQPMEGIGTGAIIWWVISNLIAVFAGGYIAGRLSSHSFKGAGILHGLVAWSLYTVISFFVLSTTVGAIFSGVGSMVTKSASAIGSGAEMIIGGAQGDQLFNLQNTIDKSLGGVNQGDNSKNSAQLITILKQVFFKNGRLNTDVQRQDVENAVARNTTLTQQQVRQVSDEIIRTYQQVVAELQNVKQEAKEAADKAASAASKAAIWGFVALLLGAIIAAVGGYTGTPPLEEVYVREEKSVYA